MPENIIKDAEKLRKKVEDQVKEFKGNHHYFIGLRDVIVATLDNAAKTLPGSPIVHGRVKAIDSFAEKCIRKHNKYDKPTWQLTDLCGVRVIVLSKDAIPHFRKFIEDNFVITEKEDTSLRLKEMEFGYQSVHYIVSLDKDKRDFYQAPDGNISELLFKTRSIEEAKIESLPIGPVFKAEIQVRTLLQHAWSAAVHDNLYKTEMKKKPQHLIRKSALIAALVEDADDSIVSLINGADEYRSFYGAYMSPEEIVNEIAIQRIILANNPENKEVALKIARLADCFYNKSEIASVEKDLSAFEEINDADILRELGMVRWKLGNNEKGRENLSKSADLNPNNPDTLCELGRTYFEEKNYWDALYYYEKAFKIAPEYPRALMRFIECRILDGKDSTFDFIPLIRHNLVKAIEASMHRIDAGMHLPYAWYDIGFFNLLLDRKYESLEAYGKAIMATSSPALVESIYVSLTEMQKKVMGKMPGLIEGMNWVRSFLRVVLVGRYKTSPKDKLCACDIRIDAFTSLAPSVRDGKTNPFRPGESVVIVAGSCSDSSKEIISRYASIISEAFKGFRGTVCSGGTASGMSGIIGNLENTDGSIRKLAYMPKEEKCMDEYLCVQTHSGSFSPLDPIMLWSDILLSGISPDTVRVLGVRGGEISAFEYQLGLLLRSKVGVLPESGGACLKIAEDPDWSYSGSVSKNTEKTCLLRLPADVETLRAFLNPSRPSGVIDPVSREKIAADIHEGYSRNARANLFKMQSNIAPWAELEATFKAANFGLIDHIEDKLKRVKLSLRKINDRKPMLYNFSEEQLIILAEMEHGRWVVERLEDGWTLGERNDEKKTRPQLIPWNELADSEKEKDYNYTKRLPEILAAEGYEIFSPAG